MELVIYMLVLIVNKYLELNHTAKRTIFMVYI